MENITEIRKRILSKIDRLNSYSAVREVEKIVLENEHMAEYLPFNDDTMNMLHKREEEYLAGKIKSMSVHEFKQKMFKEHGI